MPAPEHTPDEFIARAIAAQQAVDGVEARRKLALAIEQGMLALATELLTELDALLAFADVPPGGPRHAQTERVRDALARLRAALCTVDPKEPLP